VPRLAILIQALGTIEDLEATLLSVLENRPADCEVLVALGGSYADPYDLKGEVRFVEPHTRSSLTDCTNRALSESRAPFVHLLASGCRVTEGWTERALQRFGDRQVASVVPLVVDSNAIDRVIAAGLGYEASGRCYPVAHGQTQLPAQAMPEMIGPTCLAAFYRRSMLDQVGGFSRRLGPAQAVAEVALAMARSGLASVLESQSRVLAAQDITTNMSPFQQGLYDERLFWRNRPRSMAGHAGLIAWEAVCCLPRPRSIARLAGRVLACCQMPLLALARDRSDLPRPTTGKWRIDRPHSGAKLGESSRTAIPSR
jgi:hypothetical protein